jgi:hypothetical protein
MGHLLRLGVGWKCTLSTIHSLEIIQEGLDSLNAGVIPVVASNLPRESLGNASGDSYLLPAGSTCFAQTTLEERDDGLHWA